MKRTVWVALPSAQELQQTTVESLEDLQALVDGYIEQVPIFDDFTVWVNEEGKLRALDAAMCWPEARDVLCGVVVFDGGIDDDGETMQITDEQLTRACAYYNKNRIK